MSEALANRVEIEQSRINIESNRLNLVGIKNSLKPTLQAFAQLTNNGLTGDLTALGALNPRGRLPGGRLRQPAGADRAAQLSELLGGPFAEHTASQSRGAVRLCHQPARNPAERIDAAEECQPGSRGYPECGDRSPTGAREIRCLGQSSRSAAPDLGRRPPTISARRCDGISGDSGSARPSELGQRPSTSDGQLQPRADCVRSSAGEDTRNELHFRGRRPGG